MQHRLFAISLNMHHVPEVIVEWIWRLLFQRLDAIADVKPELNNVANWLQTHNIQAFTTAGHMRYSILLQTALL